MNHTSLVRPAIVLLAAGAFAACSSSHSTTPAPAPTPAASSAAARPSNALPAGVTPMMIAEGDSLFHARNCKNCHGADAKGARNGPDLTAGHFVHVTGSYDDFVRIIMSGVPADSIKDKAHTMPMRARGGGQPPLMNDDQVKAVAAYVYSLNHK